VFRLDSRRNQTELKGELVVAHSFKVVRVIARLNIGGPARHVVLVDRELSNRGYETLLVHGSVDSGEGSLEHLADTMRVRRLKIPELGRRISPLGDLRALAQLVKTIFRERPDVIHTHTAKAGTLGRLAGMIFNVTRSKRRRAVLVHTFHGNVLSGYFSPVASSLVRLTERSLACITDRVVAISPRQRSELVDRFHVTTDRQTVVISLGLDLDSLLHVQPGFADLRNDLGIAETDFVVGYVGRFVPIKNLIMLVRAFATAARDRRDMWLVLAGDGPSRADVELAAAESGVAHRVRLIGWIEDLPRLYATFDVCALSSLNEGTPVALIEAMAAGRAVVAAAVGGVPDVVDDGRTGLLIERSNTAALAEALGRLHAEPLLRSALAEGARAAVQSRYSSSRLAADIDRLYTSALAEKRAHSVR